MPKVCQCGGPLVAAVWTPEGYKPRPVPTRRPRQFGRCVLCFRRGFYPGRLRRLLTAETFRRAKLAQEPFPVSLGPGTLVCCTHESYERMTSGRIDPFPVFEHDLAKNTSKHSKMPQDAPEAPTGIERTSETANQSPSLGSEGQR